MDVQANLEVCGLHMSQGIFSKTIAQLLKSKKKKKKSSTQDNHSQHKRKRSTGITKTQGPVVQSIVS